MVFGMFDHALWSTQVRKRIEIEGEGVQEGGTTHFADHAGEAVPEPMIMIQIP